MRLIPYFTHCARIPFTGRYLHIYFFDFVAPAGYYNVFYDCATWIGFNTKVINFCTCDYDFDKVP